jgi:hypothetical protein
MNSRELVLFYDAKLATRAASPTGLLALHGHLNERGQIVGCVEWFATSSRAASFHCNARQISMSRNTRSSHCSAARMHAAAWSS